MSRHILRDLKLFLQLNAVHHCVCRRSDIFSRCDCRKWFETQGFAESSEAARMADARRHAEKNGTSKRSRRRTLRESCRCTLYCRKAQTSESAARIMAVVRSFRTNACRIVGGDDNKSSTDTVICRRKQGVGGDVESDVFHRRDGAHAGDRGSVGDFRRHFLIWSPFMVDALIQMEIFKDFCARSPGSSAPDAYIGFIQAARDSFIARQKCFMTCPRFASTRL